ncbi:hypothetical protein JNW88_14550 [Micromonospora sp. ATA32]|nr:hypothetical protein [Micromonospora sp. ATA32]
MRTTRLALCGTAILAATALTGCGDNNDSTGATAPPSRTAVVTPQAVATSTYPDAALQADAKEACTTIGEDIASTRAKVAKAEKIGPPAGHSAVSAQYSAGAAGTYVNTFTSSDAVNNAAKQVATAMTELADAYAKNPKQKPSTADLDAAVKQVKAICAAG